MKISASLYSSTAKSFEDLVRELDRCHIDSFHIDCMDDESVFNDIRRIRAISATPIDIHIISSEPERFFALLEEYKPEYITFQYENLPKDTRLPKIEGSRIGLALTSDTPVEAFEQYKNTCDFILLMTTTPGMSGGKFRKDNFKKIRQFRGAYPGKPIHVDGGVNDEVGFILRILGVHSVVSGSYLVNHESIGEALLHLRSSIIHSGYKIEDFMIDLPDAPVLLDEELSVKEIIRTIDAYNLGFALISGKDGQLKGISSNADVRKGLLKHLDNFNAISPDDIVNLNPVFIEQDRSITELLEMIKSKDFLISYLPVVNRQKKLSGVLSFINLIRSES